MIPDDKKKDPPKSDEKPHFVLEIQDSSQGQVTETPGKKEAEDGKGSS